MAAPVDSPDTYGNPNYAFTNSTLGAINSQGLAVGLDNYGVAGHLANTEAFATQLQPNGTWGPVTPLWSGLPDFGNGGTGSGILGISPTGQILGYGYTPEGVAEYSESYGGSATLFVYDSTHQTLTNLTQLINGTMSASGVNWILDGPDGSMDDEGRIIVYAYDGYPGSVHSLLLVPEGLPTVDPAVAPEPATWAIFAGLIGGWMVHRRLRVRAR